jgi:hypothetical protein
MKGKMGDKQRLQHIAESDSPVLKDRIAYILNNLE